MFDLGVVTLQLYNIKMKRYLILILVFTAFKSYAQDVDTYFEKANIFFKTNVANGKVAYAKIHKNQDDLNAILKLAEVVSVNKEDSEVYQAFWINTYNLAVIKGVIDNYPTKSPLDNAGFFDKTTYNLGEKRITLNDIEHKLLRAQFKDPRVHFVLVCGALGCPPLISEAYLPHVLNEQMDRQTKLALNGSFLRVNTKKKRIQASQIMEWYKGDFRMNGKKEIDFINVYRKEQIPDNYKLSYFPYDWKLNDQKNNK